MTAVTDEAELFDPDAHEPVTERAWDAHRARAAIGAIVAETESAFEHESLWPPHPLDEEADEPPLGRVASLYLGAAGVIWPCTRSGGPVWRTSMGLGRGRSHPAGAVSPGAGLPRRGRRAVPVDGRGGDPPGRHTLAPSRWQEEWLLEAVRDARTRPGS